MTQLDYIRRQQALEAWQDRVAFRILAAECVLIMVSAIVMIWSFA